MTVGIVLRLWVVEGVKGDKFLVEISNLKCLILIRIKN